MEIVGIAMMLAGAVLGLLSGVGVARLPSTLARIHAAAKPASLGLALVALGAGVTSRSLALLAVATLIVVFQFLTAPIAGHLLGRSATPVFLEPEDEGMPKVVHGCLCLGCTVERPVSCKPHRRSRRRAPGRTGFRAAPLRRPVGSIGSRAYRCRLCRRPHRGEPPDGPPGAHAADRRSGRDNCVLRPRYEGRVGCVLRCERHLFLTRHPHPRAEQPSSIPDGRPLAGPGCRCGQQRGGGAGEGWREDVRQS